VFYRNLLSPIFLFTVGTILTILPIFFTNYSFFGSYPQFNLNYNLILIYIIGWALFIAGASLAGLRVTYQPFQFNIVIEKKINVLLFSLLLILITFTLLKSILMYGGIPLLNLASLQGGANAINEAQESSGGILGILLILQFLAIAYIPILKSSTFKLFSLVKYIFFFILFVSLIYTGKRQMLFYAFFYLFGFYYLFHLRINDRAVLKRMIFKSFLIFILILGVFSLVSVIRTGGPGFFYPIAHYLSLTFINNMYMYDLVGFWHTRDFFSIFELQIPTLVRSIMDVEPTVTQPQLELTISGGLYGRVFWAYGVVGISIYCFLLGFVMQLLYKKSLKYKVLLFIYPLCIWPLIMINTYDHFMNAMFFIIPIILIIVFRLIYILLRTVYKTPTI
jgi:oligosaccharide repeat unit polymerase